MRSKPITSIDTALRLFYEKIELTNSDIDELFGKMSSKTKTAMKKTVLEEMVKRGVLQYCRSSVNTEIAYSVWGIDVENLEKRRNKLRKLGLGKS